MKPDYAEKSRFKTAPKTTVKLTDLLKVDTKKDQANQAQTVADEPYTREQLQQVWNEYAEQRKKFQAEYQLLTQPFELENNTITVSLHHPVQESMLDNMRIELSTFIRERLKNNSILITGRLEEIKEDEKKVFYTPREKFEYLIEKNPLLKEMKERLGLDTDY